ncbi:hypothetical protein HMPREF9120_02543 [Neisseria sp. oral taxon 020 str. F0370]|nr:hypothetical protein HMPREF9120_02543 [Neisseria sp. oral taxon 020 str. F0370]
MSQNKKDTRQQAVDSTGSTARRSNAVDFLFWLTIMSVCAVWRSRAGQGFDAEAV